MRILTVFGTRPEAIKMCPLVIKLRQTEGVECAVCLTGQHRQMLRQVTSLFGVAADYDLDVMRDRQSLAGITTAILEKLGPVLKSERPGIVLVHGDTTTSFAAALAAFYQQIPVGHVEAGLRTGNIYSPFPEEMNRLLVDRISGWHFCPTKANAGNLEREGAGGGIFVTGNTVIDAFQYTVKDGYAFSAEALRKVDFSSRRVITVTAHRRENLGAPLRNICGAIRRLAQKYRDAAFVYPVHPNPAVRETAFPALSGLENVLLMEPVGVPDMHNLLARSYMVMTDSGGLQEEAPHFGRPVLVLRTETERPEAVEAGTARVVGVDEGRIYGEASRLLDDSEAYDAMAHAVNPYGDGHASERIAKALLETG